MKLIWVLMITFCCFLGYSDASCDTLVDNAGSISNSWSVNYGATKCWKVRVPAGTFVSIKIISINLEISDCNYSYLTISELNSTTERKLCSGNSESSEEFTALRDVTITHYARPKYKNAYRYEYDVYASEITLEYTIQDIACIQGKHYRCDTYSCISENEVCDGVWDCSNGEDETGCEIGVLAVDGVDESRKNAIKWLKNKRTQDWGWKEETARAVTALYLSSGAFTNRNDTDDKLMMKQMEIKTSVALLRAPLPTSKLSMLINALLVTCHNPRNFYGHDLVDMLKTQVEGSSNHTQPTAYLALCNAKEDWPSTGTSELNKLLENESEYPFMKELKAQAVTALACVGTNSTTDLNSSYRKAINIFKSQQMNDGSFGNAYTTAWITQALIASGHEIDSNWNLKSAIKYLQRNMSSSTVDFQTVYLTLPIMNGKTLADVSKINCTNNMRDSLPEMSEYLGRKITVQYCLYIGDEKDIVHTISLRVPEKFTAFQLMKSAEAEDKKYEFSSKRISGHEYVYEIARLTNDAEAGKFWLLYVGNENTTELTHYSTSPDKVSLKDNDRLVMWYKIAQI